MSARARESDSRLLTRLHSLLSPSHFRLQRRCRRVQCSDQPRATVTPNPPICAAHSSACPQSRPASVRLAQHVRAPPHNCDHVAEQRHTINPHVIQDSKGYLSRSPRYRDPDVSDMLPDHRLHDTHLQGETSKTRSAKLRASPTPHTYSAWQRMPRRPCWR